MGKRHRVTEANFIYWKNLIGLLKIILFGGTVALSVIDELINSHLMIRNFIIR